jgi:hypothetical protein
MAFSIFWILESMILVMNAFAILNDRFLKKSKTPFFLFIFISLIVGLHMESMNLAANGMQQQIDPTQAQASSSGVHLDSSKNQLILFIYTFRRYMRWPLIALNTFFIMLELLVG